MQGRGPWRADPATHATQRWYTCRTCHHVWVRQGVGDMGVREGRHWAHCPRCRATRQHFVIWTRPAAEK